MRLLIAALLLASLPAAAQTRNETMLDEIAWRVFATSRLEQRR